VAVGIGIAMACSNRALPASLICGADARSIARWIVVGGATRCSIARCARPAGDPDDSMRLTRLCACCSRSVVLAIIRMTQALSIEVTAEGVETGQQIEELWRLGYWVQGFYFRAPLPASEITGFWRGGRRL
jgi:hypothetical protein